MRCYISVSVRMYHKQIKDANWANFVNSFAGLLQSLSDVSPTDRLDTRRHDTPEEEDNGRS